MPLQTFLESPNFHIPVQIMIASACYQHGAVKLRSALTLTTGAVLAGMGLVDFCIGVHMNFQHLPYTEYQELTTYVAELFKAYLLVNMFYRVWLDPRRFRFLSECIGPILLYGFLDSSQRSGYQIHGLRPLLIGLVPDVAAGLNDTEELSPYLCLWFRVAMPLYAAQYIYASDQVWAGIFLWIIYNATALGISLL